MRLSTRYVLLFAALLATVMVARAQPGPKASPSDPLDAKAPVPLAIHASPFARYRPAAEVTVSSWREANDNVTRIGGWRVYAREALQPEPAAASPAPAAPASRPDAAPARPGKP